MRVAVIGCGSISNAHLQCVQLAGDELVAAVDTDFQRARAAVEKYGGRAMTGVREMLQESAPDAAILATPPNTHLELAGLLLNAGIPVLCEKPLAHTVQDAEAMTKLAESSKVPAVVAYCHRFNPAAQAVRECVRDGRMGTVLYFRNGFTGFTRSFDGSWRLDPGISGGGALIDTASHSLDLFQFILGPIADVKASIYSRDGEGDLAGSLMLLGEKGTAGHIMFGWSNSKSDCLFEVVGTQMSASYDYTCSGNTLQIYRPGCEVENVELSGGCDVRFINQYRAFRQAVIGETTLLATFAEALSVSRVCERCYREAARVS